ncbi:chemotaxis protein CheD [Megalodesulfovibrio gigas]|uniref:Probable chemoreceptor glutamine deamidase CheD n=1 Tax=Megalodesulfovibrio gigas (strain ATCC 19364 / DSM 1382 / NCIMB 9332 / VKM B-1759) TaxID=1121448 RepID=T2GF27_MEGG1|nr:chemotaxis protein CheD [Megalodesulfovibrio gigas]AGW14774.1 putative chemotaxis protein [Megalodesulfovibrio gigas DSM 1382 = ATCC 19364]
MHLPDPCPPDAVHLGVGEGGFFAAPTMVRTVLGSCVAVTLFCPERRMGGIFHGLLPSWKEYEEATPPGPRSYRYVDSAIERLVAEFADRGVPPRHLVAKVYGGANALFQENISVAGRNVKVALETLARLGVRVAASSVGGSKSRKILFRTDTGEVTQQLLGGRGGTA